MPEKKDNTRSPEDATYSSDNSTYDARTGKLKKLGPDTKKLSDLEDVASRARLSSTAGKGLGNLEKKGPKQEPGESIQDFAARRRKYLDEQATGQKKAFESASK